MKVYLDRNSIYGICSYGQIRRVGSKKVLWETPDAYPWDAYDGPIAAARREALKRGYEVVEL